ncbi:MAG: polysaccharide biosynthesis/export family protein [Bacteroidales bacterium]|jgi:polysaccharide export outer membrane protein|nr:polysaccharide biosynthesis/export family protein [Bacteroidales bacterium]
MKKLFVLTLVAGLMPAACTGPKHLAYLNNLPETGESSYFTMEIPDYTIQIRDILYITVRAMTPDGMITDFLSASRGGLGVNFLQSESGQYMYGFDVNRNGDIILPVIGTLHLEGMTLEEARLMIQGKAEKVFPGSVTECKLLSFKFTVLGEVRAPGTYINYNNFLTVFEALGRAGGIGDYGKRNTLLVLRASEKGTTTYRLNLQDKAILSSEAYFLMPNDVVIVEPRSTKVFNMNLPLISLIVTSVTSSITMLILILNYTGGN